MIRVLTDGKEKPLESSEERVNTESIASTETLGDTSLTCSKTVRPMWLDTEPSRLQ